MASGRKGKNKGTAAQRNRKGGAQSGKRPHRTANHARLRLFAHPLFAPGVSMWAALLGGLVVTVLPVELIAALTEGTMIATFDVPMKPLLAGGLSLVLGIVVFVIAARRSAKARRRLNPYAVGNAVSRKVNPIDPARDLGSTSIDDPIETMPFASPAWRDADLDAHGEDEDWDVSGADADFIAPAPAWREAELRAGDNRLPWPTMTPSASAVAREPAPEFALPPASAAKAPRELDLAAFAQVPGRNAVWVETPSPVPAPAAAPSPAPQAEGSRAALIVPPAPGTAALSRLRAVPANELSIAQMVERFAGALHEHRANAPAHALSAAELAAREAALAEALKALAVLSGVEPAPAPAPADREAPLRAALTQLQPRRGAA
jgi:hypothetical protein